MARNAEEIPAELEEARQRMAEWRSSQTGHARIPESLWHAAVELAQKYGRCQTARALRLDYNKLKRLVGSPAKSEIETGGPAFVEFVAPTGSAECIVEMEKPGGAKIRIALKGLTTPAVVELSRALWGGMA